MLDLIRVHRADRLDLGALVEGLRGLYVEADPHDAGIRDQFEAMWSTLDAEYELRMEPWAPAGSASDEALGVAVSAFSEWIAAVRGGFSFGAWISGPRPGNRPDARRRGRTNPHARRVARWARGTEPQEGGRSGCLPPVRRVVVTGCRPASLP
jgi:hypothetical protein